ncbi:Rid family hydrolase [Sphingomonas cavernae]|nr:Rid family hydrolase [Sphingomonas cavernae]
MRLKSTSVAIHVAQGCGALLAVALTPGNALAQARTEQTVLMSANPRERAGQEQYGYASAVIAGGMIYVSGVVVGQGPGEADLVPGYERAFDQIEATLKRMGATLDDVVEMTSFHTDITAQIDLLSTVSKRRLKGQPPAWTAIDIDRLLPDQGLTEIKIVAYRPGAAPVK